MVKFKLSILSIFFFHSITSYSQTNLNVFKYVYELNNYGETIFNCNFNCWEKYYDTIYYDSCKIVTVNNKDLSVSKNVLKLKNVKSIWFHFEKQKKIYISESFNELDNLIFFVILGYSKTNLIFKSSNGLNNLKHFTAENIFLNKLPEFIYNSPNMESIAYYVDKNHEIDFYKLSKLDSLKRLLIVNAKEQNTSLNIDYMYDLKVETLELALFSPVEIDVEKLKKMKNLKRLFINIKNEEVIDEIRKLGIKVNDENYK